MCQDDAILRLHSTLHLWRFPEVSLMSMSHEFFNTPEFEVAFLVALGGYSEFWELTHTLTDARKCACARTEAHKHA